MKILNEVIKNIKIIVRNWTSLSLLVLGPLLLILLIGFAFSGEELHNINLGIISEDKEIEHILNFTQGNINYFEDAESCIEKIKESNVHICLEFSKNFIKTSEEKIIPTGTINFYYDPSDKALANLLIEGIQKSLGLKAQEISITSAKTIFGKIQTLVVFLVGAKEDSENLIAEAYSIRKDLVERRDFLTNISDNFNPTYETIKNLQNIINTNNDFENSVSNLDEGIDKIDLFINSSMNYEDITNLTNTTANITELNLLLQSIKQELENIRNYGYISVSYINQTRENINLLIYQIDQIKFYLDEEIKRTDDNIAKLDKAIARIKEINSNLDTNLEELGKLKPELSKDLINPITTEFNPLLKESNIYLLFPTVLTTIIIFISMLFSNIVTLSELNSTAYLRSFIAPVKRYVFVTGIFLTNVIILLLQISILFIVAQLNFGVNILKNVKDIYFITIIVIALFSLIGMLIAYRFKSQQTSILITTFITLIIFLMSSTVVPVELMPDAVYMFASLNPYVLGQAAFNKIILFGSYSYLNEVYTLLIYLLIVSLGLFIVLSKERTRNH